jgi:hypothetical protein
VSKFRFWLKIFILAAAVFIFAEDFYWEAPRFITGEGSSFPSTVYNEQASALIWQEAAQNRSGQGGAITLSARIHRKNGDVTVKRNFAGPFAYENEIPHISSVAVNNAGTIAVAAAAGAREIIVYLFFEGRDDFEQVLITAGGNILVAPRIYATGSGGFALFASQGEIESFSLMYSLSVTGERWSPFSPFPASINLINPFVPYMLWHNGMDVVLFQASYESGSRFTSQIYGAYSTDNCATWSAPVLITGEPSLTSATRGTFMSYQNQRPIGFSFEGRLYMAWERANISTNNAYVWVCQIDSDLRASSPEQITDAGSAVRPVLFAYNGTLSLLWADSRRGTSTAYMAQKNGLLWEETALSARGSPVTFAMPLLFDNNSAFTVIWQLNGTRSLLLSRIAELIPDNTVDPPLIIARSWTQGRAASAERVSARVAFSSDSSGIAGYSWVWTQNPNEEPPREMMRLYSDVELTGIADEDGEWFFKARALDYAGNWSHTATLRYTRDRTPPVEPKIEMLMLDEAGCLPSNTFTLNWTPRQEDSLAGYTWSLEYIAPIPRAIRQSPGHPLGVTDAEAFADVVRTFDDLISRRTPIAPPPSRIVGRGTSASFENRVNGIYAFSVAAIDEVGNIGETAVTAFALNKYIPSTVITAVSVQPDKTGALDISILGRGFTYDGSVTAVYFDRDGKAPYDYVFLADAKMFAVNSDEMISGIRSAEIEEGAYRVGLLHSDRGLYFSSVPVLRAVNQGTIKLGNFTYRFMPDVRQIARKYITLRAEYMALAVVMVLSLLGIAVSVRGISKTVADTLIVRREIQALLTGDAMPMMKKKKTETLRHRGISLRVKLVSFTISLVMMVVLLVSIPLSTLMRVSEEETLAEGLYNRVGVLLQSLSAQSRVYLPQENILDLSFVPEQGSSLEESRYVLITGMASGAAGQSTHLDYVWATNDSNIEEKIDTANLTFGASRNTSAIVSQIAQDCFALNERATLAVEEMSQGISELTAEALSLIQRTDAAAVERRQEIQNVTAQLNSRLTSELNTISKEGEGSYPRFNSTKLDRTNTNYLFYKPVLFRQGADQNYVRGIVFVEVSTEKLIADVDNSRASIFLTSLIIGLLAIGIGALGSFIMATIMVNPIKHLVRHVAMIRDTDDKEDLEGKDIVIRQKDEIGMLGETVNDMAHGLIKAAATAKDLTVGKELQKMFIPLETDSFGNKLTTGSIEDDRTHFFGYYEGAKGVSGDYFDFKKLDNRWFAVIKCDVSGKGVPASLIMVEVATLFLNYFQDWTYKKNGTNLTPIVSRINDLIESRGFKGRFAAFTLCLFDSFSGECHFCNAGDNIIHIYDSMTKKKKSIVLPETPASGVFPTFMVDMRGGFSMHSLRLNRGDVLFLYTDGIEEAKRLFRDEQFNPITCAVPGLKRDDPHGNHSVGQDGEEMTAERVNAIIEAVFEGASFTLQKWHNPIGEEKLVFDFSNCEGSAEDVILALVSVEKIFRMHKPSNATEFDRVQVDRKIDLFLRAHFKQYETYCMAREDVSGAKEYIYYTHVREDSQYDDLTLVAIKRK